MLATLYQLLLACVRSLLPGISEDFVSMRDVVLETRKLTKTISGIRDTYSDMVSDATRMSKSCLDISSSSSAFNGTLIERNSDLHNMLVHAVWERDRFFVDMLEQLEMSDHPVQNMTEDELIRYVLELLNCPYRSDEEIKSFYRARGAGRRFSSRARRQLDGIAQCPVKPTTSPEPNQQETESNNNVQQSTT